MTNDPKMSASNPNGGLDFSSMGCSPRKFMVLHEISKKQEFGGVFSFLFLPAPRQVDAWPRHSRWGKRTRTAAALGVVAVWSVPTEENLGCSSGSARPPGEDTDSKHQHQLEGVVR